MGGRGIEGGGLLMTHSEHFLPPQQCRAIVFLHGRVSLGNRCGDREVLSPAPDLVQNLIPTIETLWEGSRGYSDPTMWPHASTHLVRPQQVCNGERHASNHIIPEGGKGVRGEGGRGYVGRGVRGEGEGGTWGGGKGVRGEGGRGYVGRGEGGTWGRGYVGKGVRGEGGRGVRGEGGTWGGGKGVRGEGGRGYVGRGVRGEGGREGCLHYTHVYPYYTHTYTHMHTCTHTCTHTYTP